MFDPRERAYVEQARVGRLATADAAAVFRADRDVMREAPDEVGCLLGVFTLPPEEPFPEAFHGDPVAFTLPFYAGDVGEGEAALASLREIGDPIFDGVAPIPYLALQSMFDDANPDGNRYYWKAELFEEFSDDAIDALVAHLEANPFPTPFTQVTVEILGGAVSRVSPDATAYPHRDAMFDVGVWGNWTDPEDDERVTAWVRDCHAAVAPHAAGGVYVNYLDRDEDDRVRAAFGENYDRLADIKAKWDPENRFSNTKNVEPPA